MKFPFLDLGRVDTPLRDEMTAAVARVLASGRYIGGEECDRLECNLRELTGATHAIGISNGLDALRLILHAWVDRGDLHQGDEVIVAANTYIASILAILDAGLVPVLAPPSLTTLNIDTSRLDECLSPRTRAIMPVHLYGRAVWDNQLVDFVQRNNLLVIEDNAQAIGAIADIDGLFNSRATGALGHAGAYSFYPTKNLGAAGDAGAVVTNDADLAARVRALSNYGSDRRYHNIYQGYNCRLDPIQAAILNVKFPNLSQETNRRRQLAATYTTAIKHPLVTTPVSGGEDMVWHQYVIMISQNTNSINSTELSHRDAMRKYLLDNEVGTDIHYATPPHRQPCMTSNSYRHVADALTITDTIAQSVISLPISALTTTTDALEISNIINTFSL